MSKDQIIKAWKDEEYRTGLSESELSALPANPAGHVAIADEELEKVGGMTPLVTLIACPVSLVTVQTITICTWTDNPSLTLCPPQDLLPL